MDDIIKKLASAGVSADMIEKLKTGLGDKFESTIAKSGLKAAAEKIGLDASTLPEIDFKNALEAAEELTGKDLNRDGKVGDGDAKNGITEAIENAKEAIANTNMKDVKTFVEKNTGGLFAKVKSLFGGNKSV